MIKVYRANNTMFQSVDELIEFIVKRADCFSLSNYYGKRKLTQERIDEAILLEQAFNLQQLDVHFAETYSNLAINSERSQSLLNAKQEASMIMDERISNIRMEWEELLRKQKRMKKFYCDNYVFEEKYYKELKPFLVEKNLYPSKKHFCYFAYFFKIANETVQWLKNRKNIFDFEPDFPQFVKCKLECLSFYRKNTRFVTIDDEYHTLSIDLNEDEIEEFESIGKGYVDYRKEFVREFETDKKNSLTKQTIVAKYVDESKYPNNCFYINQYFIESDLHQAIPYEKKFYECPENKELFANILVEKGLSKLNEKDIANFFFWVPYLRAEQNGASTPGSEMIFKFFSDIPRELFLNIFTEVVKFAIFKQWRDWTKNLLNFFLNLEYNIDNIKDKAIKSFLQKIYTLSISSEKQKQFCLKEDQLFKRFRNNSTTKLPNKK